MFRSLRANAFFWLSLPLCLSSLLIPQISNVMLETMQVPSLARNSWEQLFVGSPLLATGFLWFLALLATGTLAALFHVVPPDFITTPVGQLTRSRAVFGLLVLLLFPLIIRKEWPVAVLLVFVGLAATPLVSLIVRHLSHVRMRWIVGVLLLGPGLLALGIVLYLGRGDVETRPGLLAWMFGLPSDDPVIAAKQPRYDGDLLVWLYLGLSVILLFPAAGWLIDRFCVWPVRLVKDPPLKTRFLCAGLCLLGGLVLLASFAAIGPISLGYPLSACLVSLLGGTLLGFGLWMFGGRGPTHDVFGRLLGWLVVSLLAGEALWVLASFPLPALWFSYRLYTIWAVLEVVVFVVAVASLLDTLERNTQLPARILGLAAIVLTALLVGVAAPEPLPRTELASTAKPIESEEWAKHLLARIENVPDKGPVVLVASAGGGSRAAIFAGLVLESLSRTPFGRDSRTTWGQHIVLISGVSGGSLGSARYIHSLPFDPNAPENGRTTLRHSVREELAVRMVREAAEFRAMLNERSPEEQREYGDATDKTLAFCEWFLRHVRDPENPVPPPSDYRWVVQSAIMDDLCMDFMAPLLRGGITPATSRGATLRQFWATAFHWEHCTDRAGYSHPGQEPKFDPAHHPLALYNACDVRRGCRLAIGLPPLPPYFLRKAYTRAASGHSIQAGRPGDEIEPTNPPEGLLDLDPNRSVRLTDAVGMSANFPFGFNPLTIERRRFDDKDEVSRKVPEEKRKQDLRTLDDLTAKILDGGIVDNTGIDTLYLVLEAIRQEARIAKGAGVVNVYTRIRDELLARRVYLVEIDSGAKPDKPGAATRWMSVLFDPLAGLNNSAFLNASREKRHYFTLLDARWSKGIDLSAPRAQVRSVADTLPVEAAIRKLVEQEGRGLPRFTHVSLDANHFQDENVLTAWSLGPSNKALLLVRFLIEQERARETLDRLATLARTPLAQEEKEVLEEADRSVKKLLDVPVLRLAGVLDRLKRQRDAFARLEQSGKASTQEVKTRLASFEKLLADASELAEKVPVEAGARKEIEELSNWSKVVRQELAKNTSAVKVLTTSKLPSAERIATVAGDTKAEGFQAIQLNLNALESANRTRKVQKEIDEKNSEAVKLYGRTTPRK